MRYLGKEILSKTSVSCWHRTDNCGETAPRYTEVTSYWFKGSVKEFYELSDLKRYIRKLRKSGRSK